MTTRWLRLAEPVERRPLVLRYAPALLPALLAFAARQWPVAS